MTVLEKLFHDCERGFALPDFSDFARMIAHDSMNALLQNLVTLQSIEFGGVKDKNDKNAEASLAELRAKIPSQILAHYDRLIAHGKKGIVAVHGQVCSGCHMQVPLAVVMTLRHDQDIQLCESCGRYLFLPPEAPAETVEPAASPKPEKKTRKPKKSPKAV
jgi:hypothetical protein